jgi:hydrogenase maturation factor HypF (carbamoyltransferase family)
MLLIPCSCGTTFTVSEDYDRKGTHLRSFIPCPNCGKRHDPRNRLLHLDYQDERFWTVEEC